MNLRRAEDRRAAQQQGGGRGRRGVVHRAGYRGSAAGGWERARGLAGWSRV